MRHGRERYRLIHDGKSEEIKIVNRYGEYIDSAMSLSEANTKMEVWEVRQVILLLNDPGR
jgi:hypothetical protein